MLMQGRRFIAGAAGYRYGFNGKENDNEVKGSGNQQDYGMRIYDPRIGKFLSVDPITKQYPELTPYQFASNSPIEAVDLDGLERSPAGKFGQYNETVRDNTAVQLYPNAIPVIQKQKENAPRLRVLKASANRPTATVEDSNKAAFRNNLSNPDNIGGQAAFGIYSDMHNAKSEFQEGNWGLGTLYALNAGIGTATLTGAGPVLGVKGGLEVQTELTNQGGWLRQQQGLGYESFLQTKLGGLGPFKVKGGGTSREFDGRYGENNSIWYEAKSGDFFGKGFDFEKFKSDIGRGLKVAQDHNVKYEVITEKEIPENVKSFLEKKGVSYQENISN